MDIKSMEHSCTSNSKTTIVTWSLGNTCNYSCSYCPDSLHSGSEKWVSLETCIRFCDKLISHYRQLGKSLEFLFSGGEPTLYPAFPKLIRWLKENNCQVGLISNGSRTIRFWRSVSDLLDNIVLTYHTEAASIEHFLHVVNLLSEKQRVHINVTMIPGRFEECYSHATTIAQRCTNISIYLKPLLVNFGDDLYNYNETQLDLLKKWTFNNIREDWQGSRGMMTVKTLSGDMTAMHPTEFILKDKNHWKGWDCFIGVELVYIDYRGMVYRGICRQGGSLGQVMKPDEVIFPTASIKCGKNTCHCLADIMNTRSMA